MCPFDHLEENRRKLIHHFASVAVEGGGGGEEEGARIEAKRRFKEQVIVNRLC